MENEKSSPKNFKIIKGQVSAYAGFDFLFLFCFK